MGQRRTPTSSRAGGRVHQQRQNDRGFLGMEGSHSLERFINDVARTSTIPSAVSVVEARRRRRRIASGGARSAEARDRERPPIGALGSGSDFTPFLQHLGVASLNVGFGGEDDSGIYHSIYDDFYWYTHFSDTSFVYGRALAQTAGTAVMRLADADLLPFDIHKSRRHDATVRARSSRRSRDVARKRSRERTHQLEDSAIVIVNDPRRPLHAASGRDCAAAFRFCSVA